MGKIWIRFADHSVSVALTIDNPSIGAPQRGYLKRGVLFLSDLTAFLLTHRAQSSRLLGRMSGRTRDQLENRVRKPETTAMSGTREQAFSPERRV